jgi:hypothetical protein
MARVPVPRDPTDDHTAAAAQARRDFLTERTGVWLGHGKVGKRGEIVAATVLCGELSLGSAVVAEEWVKAHDLLGRNRP